MGEDTPNDIVDGFGAALCAGDVGAATALLARHGCFVTPDSTVIRGRREVGDCLRQFVSMPGDLTIDRRTMLTAGDVAIGSEFWTLRFDSGAGPVHRTSRSTVVLARVEGAWRIAVIDPWRG